MLGADTDTEIALYQSQVTAEFTDWETTIMIYQRLVQQHLERTEQTLLLGPHKRGQVRGTSCSARGTPAL